MSNNKQSNKYTND